MARTAHRCKRFSERIRTKGSSVVRLRVNAPGIARRRHADGQTSGAPMRADCRSGICLAARGGHFRTSRQQGIAPVIEPEIVAITKVDSPRARLVDDRAVC